MIDKKSEDLIKQFVLDHQDDDPNELLLSADKYPGIPMRHVAAQLIARKKAKVKIPSWWHNTYIIYPPRLSMEQCSSEDCAMLKTSWVRGKALIDLTGGAGVDTYFLSKNFPETTYVEKDLQLCSLASHNFEKLGSEIKVVNDSAETFLQRATKVDCIYIDPARRDHANRKLYQLSDCSPNVIALLPQLFEKASEILVKTSPILDIKAAVASLKHVFAVNIVAVKNEVKEVVYHLKKDYSAGVLVGTYNLLKHGEKQLFEFLQEKEKIASIAYANPLSYLYEPNHAILKSGGFKSVGIRFNLKKLHPNSHLYTSATFRQDFPGRKFKVEAVAKLNKKEIRSLLSAKQANITVRNFPMSVEHIYKKLGLKEGGNTFIFATTFSDNTPMAIVCSKL